MPAPFLLRPFLLAPFLLGPFCWSHFAGAKSFRASGCGLRRLAKWGPDHIRPGRRIAHITGASGAALNSAITSKPWRA